MAINSLCDIYPLLVLGEQCDLGETASQEPWDQNGQPMENHLSKSPIV